MEKVKEQKKGKTNQPEKEILKDFRIAVRSREVSLLGRKEVLTGKAKFGIFGDGKEVAQIAMARAFQKGDFRSGYYRDQTFMFALEEATIQQFYAQLYAHADIKADPFSAGRSMNGHFATWTVDDNGDFLDLTNRYNSSADISPTGSQMPRLVGLAYASKMYREIEGLKEAAKFSKNGNEIAFGTIGNASCAEGMFWESVNALGVLQAPVLISIWDDGYGISVPNKYQITKDSLAEMLSGFKKKNKTDRGFDIYEVKAWDYPSLVETYQKAAEKIRKTHIPAIIHVQECTQPQGHSTSGSHERYKSKDRLKWEVDFDGINRMEEWLINEGIASKEELDNIRKEEKKNVRNQQKAAWDAYINPIKDELKVLLGKLSDLATASAAQSEKINALVKELKALREPFFRDMMVAVQKALILVRFEKSPAREALIDWRNATNSIKEEQYSSWLQNEASSSALAVPEIRPEYSAKSPMINGYEIINQFFDKVLARDSRVIAFGEDVGHIGDVNQGFAGLQDKHGKLRVSDTGIREVTILGQAIGMSMRGLRPIAEIQYLDYLLYPLQIMSDDLATLSYRTKGKQKAPAIIRTRGHRLEGIWHSGSPMAGIINLIRGIHVCVPRNFVQACGMYNTLLQGEDPGLVIEVLNGYRLKEQLPDNLGEYTVPLGHPEVLQEGTDVTVVTYGPLCRIAAQAASRLAEVGISIELIDVQTLLPFDTTGTIVASLKKTNRILFLDEDVPGGASAYMMQEVLEKQKGYFHLDSEPKTLTAKPHRPAYGSDGDYWSKPQVEDIFESVYAIMHEANPSNYPLFDHQS